MHSQREGNLIALLQLLWIKKKKKIPLVIKVGRVVGGVHLKTVIGHNMLTEPIKIPSSKPIHKTNKAQKMLRCGTYGDIYLQ